MLCRHLLVSKSSAAQFLKLDFLGAFNSSDVAGLHSCFPSTADTPKKVSVKPSSAWSVDIPSLRFISHSIPHHFCSGLMLESCSHPAPCSRRSDINRLNKVPSSN